MREPGRPGRAGRGRTGPGRGGAGRGSGDGCRRDDGARRHPARPTDADAA